MKTTWILAALSFVVCFSGTAGAHEASPVSSATLARLGLSGMEIVSDEQAAQVRGKGFVAVGGFVTGGTSYFKVGFGPNVSRSGFAVGAGGFAGGVSRAK